MRIVGGNVLLRAIELSDSQMLHTIINDAETEHMLGGWSFPVSMSRQEEWIRALKEDPQVLRCMIDRREEGTPIGTIMLTKIDYKNGNAELHIKLAAGSYRGQGYGSDAVKTIVKYAFDELRLHVIYARVNEFNTASRTMFEKCEFEQEGILKQRIYKQGRFHDVISYSICNRNEGLS